MAIQELSSLEDVQSFLSKAPLCVITFSAHWCGPCKASKPQLDQLAQSHAPSIPFGIVYEDSLGDDIHTYSVRAFPTYIVFASANEVGRIEGVNFEGLQQEITKASAGAATIPAAGGNTLGGSAGSAEQARLARLARLGGPAPVAVAAKKEEDDVQPMDTSATATTPKASDTTTAASAATEDSGTKDVAMTDTPEEPSAVDSLDPKAIETLTGEMGFTELRAQKGLLFGNGSTVESAVEWLMEHQEDEDIDEPIPKGAGKALSYKCNDCGKILSNIANLELHANQTGHTDFEESTKAITPLTPEEKAAKLVRLKELLASKRNEREESEKVDNVEREKQRRFMGKEVAKTREQMDKEKRKRDALLRKREKDSFQRERARIRAELEKDKRERMANKGKLSSKLGVDGYNPDAIQYEAETEEEAATPRKAKNTAIASAAKIDEYIKKVSSYRAGGDGGKCLKILKAYVSNVVDNPDEPKFRTINMENKTFKSKVKPFMGARHLLMAVGFGPKEGDSTALLLSDEADRQVLAEAKAKLEAAFAAF